MAASLTRERVQRAGSLVAAAQPVEVMLDVQGSWAHLEVIAEDSARIAREVAHLADLFERVSVQSTPQS